MTVYFINEGIGASNSGIEHAEFDRARLFRRNQVPFKFVTTTFNCRLHNILPMFAIPDEESINMFDYYQDALQYQGTPVTPQDIDFGMDVDAEKIDSMYQVTMNNHFMGRIGVNSRDEVQHVEFFDLFGNLYLVSQYDSRGFKSLDQWYSPDNEVEQEVWYDVHGKPVIEKSYRKVQQDRIVESWKVGTMVFRNIQELRLHFYNQLNASGSNMFIIDRTNVAEWQMTQLARPAYVVFMLHNHQSSDAQNPDAELLNDNYEWSLANMDKWNAIVSATPQQTRDLSERWGDNHKYFTVPVGVIPDMQLQQESIPMSERKPYSMLVTARVATEKGINKMIDALAIAQKQIPELTIDVFGYVDHSNNDLAQNLIDKALEKLDDPDSVQFHGHSKDVHAEHESHQVYLIFSQMEGFNLALMEAQSAGMVGIANNVYYGPNELVKNDENGFIVGYQDVDAFAERMVRLFSNPDLLQSMSDKAYELSNRYSEENVWSAWEQVFNDYDEWNQQQKENNNEN